MTEYNHVQVCPSRFLSLCLSLSLSLSLSHTHAHTHIHFLFLSVHSISICIIYPFQAPLNPTSPYSSLLRQQQQREHEPKQSCVIDGQTLNLNPKI